MTTDASGGGSAGGAAHSELLCKDSFVDYDERLITQFYHQLMVPNFPQPEELEPLENFTVKHNQCPSVELHVLIYYKTLAATDQQPEQYLIYGGVIFEFFIPVNCGLITYMLVNKETRGKGLARKLLNHAVEELDNIARAQCSLAGCNAIFLETNSSIKVPKDKDIMDPRVRHAIYHHMGLRLLNFAYVQPPLSSGQEKCNTLLLCVYLSPKIPSYQQGGETINYIPTSTVRNFYSILWKTSVERGRLTKEELQSDVDLKRSMMQLARQDEIRLLDLPWDRPWYLVELSENLDMSLLHRFYNELVAKNTRPEALEDVSVWIKNLTDSSASKPVAYHVLLALRDPDEDEYMSRPASKRTRLEDLTILVGGVTFEYYAQSNCGLISYFVVHNSHTHPFPSAASSNTHGNVVASLLERVVEIFHQTASKYGHLAGCNAIFMECSMIEKLTDTSTNSPSAANIGNSHQLLQSLGFAMLDLVYAQPPVSMAFSQADPQLSLTVLAKNSNLPRVLLPYGGAEGENFFFLPTSLVSSFIRDYWKFACSQIKGFEQDFKSNIKYMRMRDQFKRRENIPLFSALPWESAWSFLDLRTDYSNDLLQEFWKVLAKRKNPTFDLQPLSYYTRILGPSPSTPAVDGSGQFSLADEGLQAVLAISYAESHPDPILAGGAIFEYFQQSNCALITHFVVLPSKRNRTALVGRLLQEITRLLDLEATGRGHLAGCNAVFMLVHPKSTGVDGAINDETIDITANHQTLCDAGLRMLDLDFMLPPFRYRRMRTQSTSNAADAMAMTASQPVIPMLLATLVTPRIPQNGIDGTHFLPNGFISKFVSKLWRDILRRNSQDERIMDGVAYQRMLAQIRIRHKVPLVRVPWDSPFLLLDIAEDYSEDLLRSFFLDLVNPLTPRPSFGGNKPEDNEFDKETAFQEWLAMLWLPDDEDPTNDTRAGYFELVSSHSATFMPGQLGLPVHTTPPHTADPVMDPNRGPPPQSPTNNHIVVRSASTTPDVLKRNDMASYFGRRMPSAQEQQQQQQHQPPAASPSSSSASSTINSLSSSLAWLLSPMRQPATVASSTPTPMHVFARTLSSSGVPSSILDFSDGPHLLKSPPAAPVVPARKFSHVVLGLLAVDVNVDGDGDSDDSSVGGASDSALEAYTPISQANQALNPTSSHAEPAPLTKATLPAQKRTLDTSSNRIAGGIVFDYFPTINVGLISHLVIADPSHLRLCRELLSHAIETLETSAHEAGYLGGCDAIFAEAKTYNSTATDLPVTLDPPRSRSSSSSNVFSPTGSGSMDVATSASGETTPCDSRSLTGVNDVLATHPVLFQLGWRLLDLVYEPPPGSLTTLVTGRVASTEDNAAETAANKADILLLIMQSDKIPGIVRADRELRFLPSSTVANFLQTHWRTATVKGDSTSLQGVAFRRMLDQVHRRQETPVIMELPWESPAIVLDLKTDFSAELIEQFYRRFGPRETDARNDAEPFESLDEWIRELQNEDRHSHLLLALKYPRRNAMPVVVGGMLVAYLPHINCGIFSRLNMTPRSHQQGIATLLLEEGEALLDVEASEAGHIAGCHVILIETFLNPRVRASIALEPVGSVQQSGAVMLDRPRHANTMSTATPRRESERCSQVLLHSHQLIQFLDFEYLPGVKLGVYRTDRIPKKLGVASVGTNILDDVYYLPARLLRRLLKLRVENEHTPILGLSKIATKSALEKSLASLSTAEDVTLKPLMAFL